MRNFTRNPKIKQINIQYVLFKNSGLISIFGFTGSDNKSETSYIVLYLCICNNIPFKHFVRLMKHTLSIQDQLLLINKITNHYFCDISKNGKDRDSVLYRMLQDIRKYIIAQDVPMKISVD